MPGIARCIECTNNGILLDYYSKGSLGEYMSSRDPLSMLLKWDWILQATSSMGDDGKFARHDTIMYILIGTFWVESRTGLGNELFG